jgi:nitrogen regulatory protein PII
MAKKSLFSNLFSKPKEAPAQKVRRYETPKLKWVFFIVDWHQAQVVSDVFVEEKVRFHFVSKGKGTAVSEVLDLLGIGSGDKAVVTCLEQAMLVPVLLKGVRSKLKRTTPGAGIAFTVPLSAINDPVLLIFKQSILKNEKIMAEWGHLPSIDPQDKGEKMANEFTHDLIVAIVNHGFSDDFMNTARAAGATGGTVLNARGQAHQGAVKFFGVSVQDEKEIIIILAAREKKVAIMQAVSEAHGLNSEAQGIVFSLPVDSVLGLNSE